MIKEYKHGDHVLVFNPDGRPRYTIDGKQATGVTTILGTINKPELQPWVARMCAKAAFINAKAMSDEELEPMIAELNKYPKLSSKEAKAVGEKYPLFADAIIAHTKRSDDAKDIGTEAHADVEAYIRYKMGETDSFTPNPATIHMVQPFIDWAEGRMPVKKPTYKYDKNSIEISPTTIKFLRAEQSVFSLKYFYAGTFDFLCEIDGKKYICDFKTSTGIYGREYFYQTAAYRNAIGELGWGTDIAGSIIIRSGKEGNDLEVKHSLAYEQDFSAFLAAYVLYKEGFVEPDTTEEIKTLAQ